MILSYGFLALPKYSWRLDRYSSLESRRDQQRDSCSPAKTKKRFLLSYVCCTLIGDTLHHSCMTNKEKLEQVERRLRDAHWDLQLLHLAEFSVGMGEKRRFYGLLTKVFSGIKFHRKFLSFFYLFSFCLLWLYLLCTQKNFISLLPSCFVIFRFKKCKKNPWKLLGLFILLHLMSEEEKRRKKILSKLWKLLMHFISKSWKSKHFLFNFWDQ